MGVCGWVGRLGCQNGWGGRDVNRVLVSCKRKDEEEGVFTQ